MYFFALLLKIRVQNIYYKNCFNIKFIPLLNGREVIYHSRSVNFQSRLVFPKRVSRKHQL